MEFVAPQQEKYNMHLSAIADSIKLRPSGLPQIRLLGDQCLVRIEKPERMKHGLWIPDTAERPDSEVYQATVLAVGPGKRRKDGRINQNELQPGDRVVFYWLAGEAGITSLMIEGEECRIIPESSVQAVLED